MRRHSADGRILGINAALINDWTITYGLHDIRGCDPPQPSLRLFRLWRVAEPGQLDWMSFSMNSLSPTVLQVASVLGARWVIADPGVQRPELHDASERALHVVHDGRDARVWRNDRAAPRALAGPVVREDAARAVLAESGLDPRREVVVVRGDVGSADANVLSGAGGGVAGSAGAARGPAGRVMVDDASPSRVVLHASLPRPGLVVLNDGWAPGWSVRVDGRDATEVRVNETMRGVAVGAGAHEVEWRYRVPGLR